MVSKADLEVTGVAFSVRKLRKSEHLEVQRIASNLIDKWKRAILSEREALNNIAIAQQQQLSQQQQEAPPVAHVESAQEQRIEIS